MTVAVLSVFLGGATPARCQEWPAPTEQGTRDLAALADACVRAGGLKRVDGPKGGASRLAPADGAKLRGAVAAARGRLGRAVCDAAVDRWKQGDAAERPAWAALLRAAGEESGDERTLAFADLFSAAAAAQTARPADALPALRDAARRFSACREPSWHAAALVEQGNVYHALRRFDEAADRYRLALEARRALYGDGHPDVAACHLNLGNVDYARGRYGDAAAAWNRGLAIVRKAKGAKDPAVADYLSNLGSAYTALERHGEAVRALREAADVIAAARGENDPALVPVLVKLALAHRFQGENGEAGRLYRRALGIVRAANGPDAPGAVDLLNSLGATLSSQARPGEAAEAHREALGIARKAFGERSVQAAGCLEELGKLAADRNDPGEAERLLGEALDIFVAVRGEGHPDVGFCRMSLARVADARRDFVAAERHYRRAVGAFRSSLGGKHFMVGRALICLGLVCVQRGDLAAAGAAFAEARDVTRAALGEGHPQFAECLNGLGDVAHARGELEDADGLFRRAYDLMRKAYGEDHPDVVLCLANLASVCTARGDYGEAVRLNRRAASAARRVYGPSHPRYAARLRGLALCLTSRGDEAEAARVFRKALEIQRSAPGADLPAVAALTGDLGGLAARKGDYPEALRLHRTKLDGLRRAYGDGHPALGEALLELGDDYHGQGDEARAARTYAEAVDLLRKGYGDDDPWVAHASKRLGDALKARGDYAPAEGAYRTAIEGARRHRGERHPEVAHFLQALADLYQRQGNFPKALETVESALAALRRPDAPLPARGAPTHADLLRPTGLAADLLVYRGELLEWQLPPDPGPDRLLACRRAYEEAGAVLDRVRSESLSVSEDKARLLARVHLEMFARRVDLSRRLAATTGNPSYVDGAYAAAEEARARAFVEQLARSRAGDLGGVPPQVRAEEQRLLRLTDQLDHQLDTEQARPLGQRDAERVGELLARRRRAEDDLQNLSRRLEAEHPAYAALVRPRPCSLAEARSCLRPDEVALLYVLGGARSYLVVLGPTAGDGPEVFELPPRGELEELVAALTDPETLSSPSLAREGGAEAYRRLLAPAAASVRGKSLVVVPDGQLGEFPFELLVEPGAGRYLVERRRVRYAPSLTALHLVRRWDQARKPPGRGLWAVGDPVYAADDPRLGRAPWMGAPDRPPAEPAPGAGGFARLLHSGREVLAVRDALGGDGAVLLTGREASEAAVKRASVDGRLADYRHVHFATHGVLGTGDGVQPALVLSLIGDDAEDGFLRLDEVTCLRLNADLVVLSACRTGGGRLDPGEGVSGLARAFLYAGSRGVVCSLWAVDDETTEALMTDFYRRIRGGRPAADALRDAKQALVDAGKPPRYWAPFVLIGE
jgi:CHAT domain-containing protein/Tfp pilus assembly protein PilF